MDSDIAYFVINNIYLDKQEFLFRICQKNFTHLIKYIDLENKIHKMNQKNIKFWFIKEEWGIEMAKSFSYEKSIENIDYNYTTIFQESSEEDVDVEIETKQFSTKFLKLNSNNECKYALDNISYIKEKYRYYIENLNYLNIN